MQRLDPDVPRHGLTTEEAAHRLAQDGANVLPREPSPSAARRVAAQLVHAFALLLWAAAVLAWIGGMPELAVAIVVVVLVNGLFSFLQEARAERATQALGRLMPAAAAVIRDGRRQAIGVEAIVVGDLLVLAEGDRVPADARVVEAHALQLDEAVVTGESEPVERTADPHGSPVLAGTYVVAGSGLAVVAATGAATVLGSIARLTSGVVRRRTPLRLGLDRAVRVIGVSAVLAGLLFFGAAVAIALPARDAFLLAVGVIVALIPEGLLPTVTLALAMSAHRMAGRRALVRHLDAVETLGAATVICTDKTGTLTANRMVARAVWTPGLEVEATGAGYDLDGTLLAAGRPLGAAAAAALRPLLVAAALVNDAVIATDGGVARCLGDPTEGALLALAGKGGVDRHDAARDLPRVAAFPFASARRRMATVHLAADGPRYRVLVKGSPEAVLEACAIDDVGRGAALAAADALAHRGLRVLALAQASRDGVPAVAEDAERALELLGLVGVEDPVRPEVPAAIERCRAAGIRVLVLTGDHPGTAGAVARRVGLDDARALVGTDLPADEAGLGALLGAHEWVIARLAPEQKLRIAAALQARGDVVAMTGDGVNDAPALRRADIGVAMGATGTDVAREASDLVLLDDSFAHIVEAVEEGRAAFANVRRFLTYHLTDNVAELAPFALWALSGGTVPLLLSVLQVLALDIGTDLLPALALGAEPAEPDAMAERPRRSDAPILDRGVLARAFAFLGPLEAALSLAMLPAGAALLLGWGPGDPLPDADGDVAMLSTMVFAAIVLMQMANAFACRSTRRSLLATPLAGNPLVLLAVGVELALLLAFVYVPGLDDVLGQRPLGAVAWLPVLVTPVVLTLAEEVRKAVVRRRAARRREAPG